MRYFTTKSFKSLGSVISLVCIIDKNYINYIKPVILLSI